MFDDKVMKSLVEESCLSLMAAQNSLFYCEDHKLEIACCRLVGVTTCRNSSAIAQIKS